MHVSSLVRVRTLVVVARGGVRGGEEVGEAVDGVLGGGEGDGIRARGARLGEGGRGASPRRGGEPNGVGQERRAVALEKSDVDVETRHARAPERRHRVEGPRGGGGAPQLMRADLDCGHPTARRRVQGERRRRERGNKGDEEEKRRA